MSSAASTAGSTGSGQPGLLLRLAAAPHAATAYGWWWMRRRLLGASLTETINACGASEIAAVIAVARASQVLRAS